MIFELPCTSGGDRSAGIPPRRYRTHQQLAVSHSIPACISNVYTAFRRMPTSKNKMSCTNEAACIRETLLLVCRTYEDRRQSRTYRGSRPKNEQRFHLPHKFTPRCSCRFPHALFLPSCPCALPLARPLSDKPILRLRNQCDQPHAFSGPLPRSFH